MGSSRRHRTTRGQGKTNPGTPSASSRRVVPALIAAGAVLYGLMAFLPRGPAPLTEAWTIHVGAPAQAAWSPTGMVTIHVTSGGGQLLWVDAQGTVSRRLELAGGRVLALSYAGVAVRAGHTLTTFGPAGQTRVITYRHEPSGAFWTEPGLVLTRPVPRSRGILDGHLEAVAGEDRWKRTLEAMVPLEAMALSGGLLVTAVSTVEGQIQTSLHLLVRGLTQWELPLGERLPLGPVPVPGGAAVAVGDTIRAISSGGAQLGRWRLSGEVGALAAAGTGVAAGVSARTLLGEPRYEVVYVENPDRRPRRVAVGGPVEHLAGDDRKVAALAGGELLLLDLATGRSTRHPAPGWVWVALDGPKIVALTKDGNLSGFRLPGP